MLKKIATTFTAIALSGCASSVVQVQVNSQPVGAYITEVSSGTAFGISPVLVQYPRASLEQKDSAGCALVKGFNARWVSGATSTTGPTIRLCGSGEFYSINIARDESAPGFDKDMDFSLRLGAASAAQRQAAAAEDASTLLFLQFAKPGK